MHPEGFGSVGLPPLPVTGTRIVAGRQAGEGRRSRLGVVEECGTEGGSAAAEGSDVVQPLAEALPPLKGAQKRRQQLSAVEEVTHSNKAKTRRLRGGPAADTTLPAPETFVGEEAPKQQRRATRKASEKAPLEDSGRNGPEPVLLAPQKAVEDEPAVADEKTSRRANIRKGKAAEVTEPPAAPEPAAAFGSVDAKEPIGGGRRMRRAVQGASITADHCPSAPPKEAAKQAPVTRGGQYVPPTDGGAVSADTVVEAAPPVRGGGGRRRQREEAEAPVVAAAATEEVQPEVLRKPTRSGRAAGVVGVAPIPAPVPAPVHAPVVPIDASVADQSKNAKRKKVTAAAAAEAPPPISLPASAPEPSSVVGPPPPSASVPPAGRRGGAPTTATKTRCSTVLHAPPVSTGSEALQQQQQQPAGKRRRGEEESQGAEPEVRSRGKKDNVDCKRPREEAEVPPPPQRMTRGGKGGVGQQVAEAVEVSHAVAIPASKGRKQGRDEGSGVVVVAQQEADGGGKRKTRRS